MYPMQLYPMQLHQMQLYQMQLYQMHPMQCIKRMYQMQLYPMQWHKMISILSQGAPKWRCGAPVDKYTESPRNA